MKIIKNKFFIIGIIIILLGVFLLIYFKNHGTNITFPIVIILIGFVNIFNFKLKNVNPIIKNLIHLFCFVILVISFIYLFYK